MGGWIVTFMVDRRNGGPRYLLFASYQWRKPTLMDIFLLQCRIYSYRILGRYHSGEGPPTTSERTCRREKNRTVLHSSWYMSRSMWKFFFFSSPRIMQLSGEFCAQLLLTTLTPTLHSAHNLVCEESGSRCDHSCASGGCDGTNLPYHYFSSD